MANGGKMLGRKERILIIPHVLLDHPVEQLQIWSIGLTNQVKQCLTMLTFQQCL
jgi:hypothetical protein